MGRDIVGGEEEAVKSLERYFSVMKDESTARFRICKKVPVDVDLDSDEEELWDAHEESMERFGDILGRIDKDGVELSDFTNCETSLLDLKVELSKRVLKNCHFCERRCGVDRTEGEKGFCDVEGPSDILELCPPRRGNGVGSFLHNLF